MSLVLCQSPFQEFYVKYATYPLKSTLDEGVPVLVEVGEDSVLILQSAVDPLTSAKLGGRDLR